MTHPDAVTWNSRYSADLKAWRARPPHSLLVEHAAWLPASGLALDGASGVGRDAVFLARRGLHVLALDISRVALRAAQSRAQLENLPLFPAVYDLSHLWLPEKCLDVILNFYFLERSAFPAYRCSLKPGGLLFFETFLQTDEAHPNYLQPGELRRAFDGFERLHWKIRPREAPPPGRSRLVEQLIVRKP